MSLHFVVVMFRVCIACWPNRSSQEQDSHGLSAIFQACSRICIAWWPKILGTCRFYMDFHGFWWIAQDFSWICLVWWPSFLGFCRILVILQRTALHNGQVSQAYIYIYDFHWALTTLWSSPSGMAQSFKPWDCACSDPDRSCHTIGSYYHGICLLS